MKFIAISETEDEDAVFTPWSAVHFFSGSAAKEWKVPFWWFQLGHVMYETKDQLRNQEDLYQNSFLNSVGDQLGATAGWLAVTPPKGYKYTILFIASWLGAISLGDRIG